MKYTLMLLLNCLLFFACNSPYYTSVNKMRSQPATLTLTNGTVIDGKVSVNANSNFINVTKIQFATGAEKEYKEYFINDIKSLFINGSTYCVKLLINNALSSDVFQFVKLLSSPNSKMELYQNDVVKKVNRSTTKETTVQYYLQLPGATHNEVYNVESGKFTPNFDDKMSAIVQDCPNLADKIKSKDKDYFYPYLLSNGELRRKAVLIQIINDYNSCK
jgi:hypothetical protein